MSSYIPSSVNRFYVAREMDYGQAAPADSTCRFPARSVQARQSLQNIKRLDKTGTRTYQGQAVSGRRQTEFKVHSYLSPWSGSGGPSYGPLFEAACGAKPIYTSGLVVNSLVNSLEIVTASPHGLTIGCGIANRSEIRFVTGELNPYTFTINAPFTNLLESGDLLGPTVTYGLASDLPSVTLYDYWDRNLVSRLVVGCGVNTLEVVINGDYHEFYFSGPASDLIAEASFETGGSGLTEFPDEPAQTRFNAAGVPGHLGQVWLGVSPTEFYTLTEARIDLTNNLDVRKNEFGFVRPTALVPGERQVTCKFALLVQDDDQTISLYTAAKQRTPISAMLQLGTQPGQLMGIYLPAVVAEMPDYNDSEARLKWDFQSNVAQGSSDDELFLAFA